MTPSTTIGTAHRADQTRRASPTHATGTAGTADPAGPAHAPGPTVTEQQPTIAACATGTADPAGAPGAPATTHPARATRNARVHPRRTARPDSPGPADTPSTPGTPRPNQPRLTTTTTGTTDGAHRATPGPAGPTIAVPPPPATPRPARRIGPTHTTAAAVTDQPRRTPGTTSHPGIGARRAVAAITNQQPTVTPGLPRRTAIGAITNQRTPQQHLSGRIDQVQQCLQRIDIGRLGANIGRRAATQRLHKPGVKHRHLRADQLILLPMSADQRRNTHRHLIGSGRHQPGRRPRRDRVGITQRRLEPSHILGHRRKRFRGHQHIRRHHSLRAIADNCGQSISLT